MYGGRKRQGLFEEQAFAIRIEATYLKLRGNVLTKEA